MPAKLAIKAHGPEGKGVGYSGSLKKEEKLFPKDRKEDSEQKKYKKGREGGFICFLSRLSRRRKKKELKKKEEKGPGEALRKRTLKQQASPCSPTPVS